jgi:hypothetical protein
MIEIKDAIYAVLVADAGIVSMLGSAEAISSAWPATNAKFAAASTGVADYATLPPTSADAPRARIAIATVSPIENTQAFIHDDDYQVSIFSLDERLVGALARRVRDALNATPLSLPAGLEFRETAASFGPDQFEQDTRLFHQPMNVHVRWIG